MRLIDLTKGMSVQVNSEDYEELAKHKWYAHHSNAGKYYAARREYVPGGKGKSNFIYMHRQILGYPDGMDTDHINGDGLDNRRYNLRMVPHAVNQRNLKKFTKNGTTGIHKVRSGRYQVKGNTLGYLGTFETLEEAMAARNLAWEKNGAI